MKSEWTCADENDSEPYYPKSLVTDYNNQVDSNQVI